jgi:hypothetical protein
MPISSGIAVVATLLRFIAASIPMKFVDFPRPHEHWRLHPGVVVDVGRGAAFTAAQHILGGHLLSIRREGAGRVSVCPVGPLNVARVFPTKRKAEVLSLLMGWNSPFGTASKVSTLV